MQYQLVISEMVSCEGRSYFPLPKEPINSMKGLIIIQNKDSECLRWCLVRYKYFKQKSKAN